MKKVIYWRIRKFDDGTLLELVSVYDEGIFIKLFKEEVS